MLLKRKTSHVSDSVGMIIFTRVLFVLFLSSLFLFMYYSSHYYFTLSSLSDFKSDVVIVPLVEVIVKPTLPCSDCNVIFISVDTLRADHLRTYGYFKNTTPSLDAFSSDAVVYMNDFSQAPWTLPSHFSMFTSQIPNHTGTTSMSDDLDRG